MKQELIAKLFDLGAIQFGQFQLKSGLTSPLYIDLRLIVSSPTLLKEITQLLQRQAAVLQFDLLCGVPYTALPLATALSLALHKPMVIQRKEAKAYGTKRMVEGIFERGQRSLIIEDVVTSGSSVQRSIEILRGEGLEVADVLVIIDREQGGRAQLEAGGLHVHPLLTLSEILSVLVEKGKIDKKRADAVRQWISSSQVCAHE